MKYLDEAGVKALWNKSKSTFLKQGNGLDTLSYNATASNDGQVIMGGYSGGSLSLHPVKTIPDSILPNIPLSKLPAGALERLINAANADTAISTLNDDTKIQVGDTFRPTASMTIYKSKTTGKVTYGTSTVINGTSADTVNLVANHLYIVDENRNLVEYTAGTATNANHASNADHANSADTATNATHATSADKATNADHATTASNISGTIPASKVITGTSTNLETALNGVVSSLYPDGAYRNGYFDHSGSDPILDWYMSDGSGNLNSTKEYTIYFKGGAATTADSNHINDSILVNQVAGTSTDNADSSDSDINNCKFTFAINKTWFDKQFTAYTSTEVTGWLN